MEHFSYSILLSLLHSLWQAALLVCLFAFIDIFNKRTHPIVKRNILFLFLGTQILTTFITFIIYYTRSSFFDFTNLVNNIDTLLIIQPIIINVAPWLMAVYIIVITVKTIRLILKWKQFKNSSYSTRIKPPIDLKLFCLLKANELGIRRKVILWYSSTINTPLTFGFFKPIILLPVALVNNLSLLETESLIIHELSHIKSNDYFFNWFLIFSETVFFFNPFIIITINRIRLEREKNCDAKVLQFNYTSLTYAETLLKAARFKTTPAPFFLAAVFKNTQLIHRVRFFTKESNLKFYKKNYSIIAILPVLFIFFTCIYFVNFIKTNRVEYLQIKNQQAAAGINNKKIAARTSMTMLPVIDMEYPATKISNNPTDIKINDPDIDLNQEIKNQQTSFKEFALTVALPQEEMNKEVILKEENSASGKSITKAYRMQLLNGKWKANLLWSIIETRPLYDSLPYSRDTIGFYNLSQ